MKDIKSVVIKFKRIQRSKITVDKDYALLINVQNKFIQMTNELTKFVSLKNAYPRKRLP